LSNSLRLNIKIYILIFFLLLYFLGPPTCKYSQFQCALSKKCIPREWICDGELDCGASLNSTEQDASDEDSLQCKNFNAKSSEIDGLKKH